MTFGPREGSSNFIFIIDKVSVYVPNLLYLVDCVLPILIDE